MLINFPHLQDFRAAPHRLTWCCSTTGPLSQSQTSSHVGTKWRTWSLRLETERNTKRGKCQCLAMSALSPPVYMFSMFVCASTSTVGKSCQLRFLRLGGVMSGFCFPSNHMDHTLWWLGFRMVMPNSSGKVTNTSKCL